MLHVVRFRDDRYLNAVNDDLIAPRSDILGYDLRTFSGAPI